MVKIEDLEFRKLNFQNLVTLVDWARKEGWNPGPNDAEVFWSTDPNGFYGYFYNDDFVAGGAIISYNDEFGFMGLFIVKPEFRALGIGRKLWYQRRDLLLKRLQPNSSIGMDGVVDMQNFYQKGGFHILFKDERYENIGSSFQVDANISNIHGEDLEEIFQYDQQCFGFLRTQFLNPWIKLPRNKNLKYLKNGQIKGFCIVRKVNIGYKIGPLFAENAVVAEELYKASLNSVIGEPIFIDIPMINEKAIHLVNKYHAKYVFECARMYHGQAPPIPIKKVFGITSFELG